MSSTEISSSCLGVDLFTAGVGFALLFAGGTYPSVDSHFAESNMRFSPTISVLYLLVPSCASQFLV
jgi:hypothetical protein